MGIHGQRIVTDSLSTQCIGSRAVPTQNGFAAWLVNFVFFLPGRWKEGRENWVLVLAEVISLRSCAQESRAE